MKGGRDENTPVRFACRAVREMNLAGVVFDEETMGRRDEGMLL